VYSLEADNNIDYRKNIEEKTDLLLGKFLRTFGHKNSRIAKSGDILEGQWAMWLF
jgi:hypothetical protein